MVLWPQDASSIRHRWKDQNVQRIEVEGSATQLDDPLLAHRTEEFARSEAQTQEGVPPPPKILKASSVKSNLANCFLKI